MLNEGLAPFSELAFRVGRRLWKRREVRRLREVLHRFADQRFLGTKLAEDRDLVDARGIGDASSSRAAEAVLCKDAGGCVEDFVSGIHGCGFYTEL